MNDLSIHFDKNEFKCPCCGKVKVSQSLVYLLEAIREHFNKPINITSGYRCPKHNMEVGGAGNSQHLYGTAADITISGIKALDVYDYCDKLNLLGGVGKYNGFTHIDSRNGKARW